MTSSEQNYMLTTVIIGGHVAIQCAGSCCSDLHDQHLITRTALRRWAGRLAFPTPARATCALIAEHLRDVVFSIVSDHPARGRAGAAP
jgi:hypothetical protein